MKIITNVDKILGLYIPTESWFSANSVYWNEIKGKARFLLSYLNLITTLIGSKKQKKLNTPPKPTDENAETDESEKHGPLFYLQILEDEKCEYPNYIIYILLRDGGKEFTEAIDVSIDDLNIKYEKELLQKRKNMVVEKKRKRDDILTCITSPAQLKDILKIYIKDIPILDLKAFKLNSITTDKVLVPEQVESIFKLDFITLLLKKSNLNTKNFDSFLGGWNKTKKRVGIPNDFIELNDVDFLSVDKRLPHCDMDKQYINMIGIIYKFKDKSTIDGELLKAVKNDQLDLAFNESDTGGIKSYNDIFGLIQNYNTPDFKKLESAFGNVVTTSDLRDNYRPLVDEYLDTKLDLFLKIISKTAPEKVTSLYPLPVAALLKWVYINRYDNKEIMLFQKKTKDGEYVLQNFSMFIEGLNAVSNFTVYFIKVLNNIEFSTPYNNNVFLCTFTSQLGQYSSDDENLAILNHIQGLPGVSKSHPLGKLKAFSIDDTYNDMDDAGSSHKDTTSTRRTYSSLISDEAPDSICSTNMKDLDAQNKMKKMITTKKISRVSMRFSSDGKDRFTEEHKADMRIVYNGASNHQIENKGLKDRFTIHNVYTSKDHDEIDDLKLAKAMEDIMKPKAAKESKDFVKDCLFLVAISQLAITTKSQFPVTTNVARIVLSDLKRDLLNSNLIINITKREIDKITKSATDKTILNSWLQVMALKDSTGYGKVLSKELILEAAKWQCVSLQTTVLALSELFETFQNQVVKKTIEIVFEILFPVKQLVENFYKNNYGLVYKMNKLNYHHHIFALLSEERNAFNLRMVMTDRELFDPNYITFTTTSEATAVSTIYDHLEKISIFESKQVSKALKKSEYFMRPETVFKFIDKFELISYVNTIVKQKAKYTELIQKFFTEKGYKKPYTIDEMEDAVFHVHSSTDIMQYITSDGECFHSSCPHLTYNIENGLPIIKVDSKKKDAVKISFLIEAFRTDARDVLIDCIKNLGKFVVEPTQVLITYGAELKPITIHPIENTNPSMINFYKKKKIGSDDILNAMHGIDETIDTPEGEYPTPTIDFINQTKLDNVIDFGGLSLDNFFWRLHLDQYGSSERETNKYIY